jgi:hypothetical protein
MHMRTYDENFYNRTHTSEIHEKTFAYSGSWIKNMPRRQRYFCCCCSLAPFSILLLANKGNASTRQTKREGRKVDIIAVLAGADGEGMEPFSTTR